MFALRQGGKRGFVDVVGEVDDDESEAVVRNRRRLNAFLSVGFTVILWQTTLSNPEKCLIPPIRFNFDEMDDAKCRAVTRYVTCCYCLSESVCLGLDGSSIFTYGHAFNLMFS